MRVAAIQHDIVWENPAATRARLEPWLAAAAGAGAGLVVLPEMFACGFSMAADRIAEPWDGPTVQWMCERAAAHGLWVAGSVPERPREPPGGGAEPDQRPANTLVVAAADGTVHRYRKLFPFTPAGEGEVYARGERTVVVEVGGLRLGLFVCYDLRFADVFWRLAPEVHGYLVVANWPEPRREHWQVLLRARAIENQAYVVGVNRVGSGGSLRYVGDSRIVGPRGELLQAAAEQETMLLADLRVEEVAAARSALPFLADRRDDLG
jgi:predicted amidohydrolase